MLSNFEYQLKNYAIYSSQSEYKQTNFWLVIFCSIIFLAGFFLSYACIRMDSRYDNHLSQMVGITKQSTSAETNFRVSSKSERIYYNLGKNYKAMFDHSLKAK